jgi:hypothetical protein
MHGTVKMGKKPALQPTEAIGPTLRAVAAYVLTGARSAMTDPQLSPQDAVHLFRRDMKEWRALMRLLAPFVPNADRWQAEARDHARSLSHARDGAAALNAFEDVLAKGMVLSPRSAANVRGRLEAMRDSEERAVLTPQLREAIIAWLDGASAAVEQWPLDPFDFPPIAGQLAAGYRSARARLPDNWTLATPHELHALRRRVVDHRYQIELIVPLWPRFGRMWIEEAERLRGRLGKCQDLAVLERLTGLHQPLAHWRSKLVPACAERRFELSQRAARIAHRLFAERPRAFRRRVEALWGTRR